MTIPEIIDFLKLNWSEPAHTTKDHMESLFRFACSFTEGHPGLPENYPYNVPTEVKDFWATASTAELFQDVDYGQWGLEILSPEESASRSERDREYYPDFRSDELIIGRFRGDSEILIVSCGDDEYGTIRVGLPIDKYPDWPVVAKNFKEFLEKYAEADGNKYWEHHRARKG